MAESTKKIIAKSKAEYRKFTIYELGPSNFGIVVNGKLLDGFISLGEVRAYIDSYYLLKNYTWN